mmetsp:Transcript_47311/g.107291  ORF Transcript_47311/g.107291 Transcript_47311/m.107291 type:complete len:97 (+) Transcript_47311:204-494(+)
MHIRPLGRGVHSLWRACQCLQHFERDDAATGQGGFGFLQRRCQMMGAPQRALTTRAATSQQVAEMVVMFRAQQTTSSPAIPPARSLRCYCLVRMRS